MNPIENLRDRVEQFKQQHPSVNLEALDDLLGKLKVDEHNEDQIKEQIAHAEALIQGTIMNFPFIQGHVETIQFLEELEMELMELNQNLQGRQTEDNSTSGMLE